MDEEETSLAQGCWKVRTNAVPAIVIADNTAAMANKYFRSLSAYEPATSTVTEMTFMIKMPSCSETTKGAVTKRRSMVISNRQVAPLILTRRHGNGYSRFA
jgi:hypothetical protein